MSGIQVLCCILGDGRGRVDWGSVSFLYGSCLVCCKAEAESHEAVARQMTNFTLVNKSCN